MTLAVIAVEVSSDGWLPLSKKKLKLKSLTLSNNNDRKSQSPNFQSPNINKEMSSPKCSNYGQINSPHVTQDFSKSRSGRTIKKPVRFGLE